MRRIVVGIIAVFFLQVGFQLYSAVERTNYNYAFVSASVPSRSMQEVEVSDVNDAYIESAVLPAAPEASVPRAYRAALRRPRPAQNVYIARSTGKPLFPTVEITIPQPARYEFASHKPRTVESPAPKQMTAQAPRAETVKPEKRSVPQKALTVVKKPYDFLKFVASKLH